MIKKWNYKKKLNKKGLEIDQFSFWLNCNCIGRLSLAKNFAYKKVNMYSTTYLHASLHVKQGKQTSKRYSVRANRERKRRIE